MHLLPNPAYRRKRLPTGVHVYPVSVCDPFISKNEAQHLLNSKKYSQVDLVVNGSVLNKNVGKAYFQRFKH